MKIPDRLSVKPGSSFFDPHVARDIDVYFNGVQKHNVEEYCISEGWVRVIAGRTRDRFGVPISFKLSGKVQITLKGQKPSVSE